MIEESCTENFLRALIYRTALKVKYAFIYMKMKPSCGKVLHTQNSILNAISMYCVTAIHSPYLIPVLSIRTILVYQNIARPHSVFGTQTNNCLVCFALWPDATWRHELETLGSTCQEEILGKNLLEDLG